jgi:hypothetical protein
LKTLAHIKNTTIKLCHFIHNGVHGIDEGTHAIKKDAHVNDMGGIDYGMVEHFNHMVHMSLTMYAHVNNTPPHAMDMRRSKPCFEQRKQSGQVGKLSRA